MPITKRERKYRTYTTRAWPDCPLCGKTVPCEALSDLECDDDCPRYENCTGHKDCDCDCSMMDFHGEFVNLRTQIVELEGIICHLSQEVNTLMRTRQKIVQFPFPRNDIKGINLSSNAWETYQRIVDEWSQLQDHRKKLTKL